MTKFSIIIPVYNRPDEVDELLDSLSRQRGVPKGTFEVIIVEDGSTVPCKEVVEKYSGALDVAYIYKENEGRSIARNVGIEASKGDYLVFFDSDCVIPPDYFACLSDELAIDPVDCYGGPDAAHESFSDTQKAINYAMTSFWTTGGIRGGKVQLEKFVPRTFNTGFSRKVYDTVGGFREMFSEDIDMSTRIKNAGFSIRLIRPAYVYHKRRVDFAKFMRQVYVFGMSRITLKLLYPGSLKAVHTLPALFLTGCVLLVVLACLVSPWFLLPIAAYILLLWVSALISTRSLKIAFMAVPAAFIQLWGYGWGFIRAYVTNILLGRGRDLAREIEMRRGK
ncbi:MAG: glycosyltransferase [Clostridiales bacterium]|nr:glycosyltransferase [Clostridiales bacterium]